MKKIALVYLALLITVIGCQKEPLEGTWIGITGLTRMALTFDGENYEFSQNGVPFERGTFSATDGTVTLTVEEMHGNIWVAIGGFENKWYTKDEMVLHFRDSFSLPDEEALERTNEMFSVTHHAYSIKRDVLTITFSWGVRTYKRQ